MKRDEFLDKLLSIVNNYKTIYAYGTWGQILNNSIINNKADQYKWWYTQERINMLRNLVGQGYYVFDCVGLIKGVLWGWCGNGTTNGGAEYKSNGVPDLSANEMIGKCYNVSTNFSNIEPGEAVWMEGHIGIYWQDGKVIECSPAFQNKVQITNLSQRQWLKHGKLPYVDYNDGGFFPYKGYLEKGDSGASVEKIDEWYMKWIPENVKGDFFGNFTEKCTMALQEKAKAEGIYDDLIDGKFGPKTLAAAKHYGFKE